MIIHLHIWQWLPRKITIRLHVNIIPRLNDIWRVWKHYRFFLYPVVLSPISLRLHANIYLSVISNIRNKRTQYSVRGLSVWFYIVNLRLPCHQALVSPYPLLLTCIYFNPSMDIYNTHMPSDYWDKVGQNYLSLPDLQRLHRWSLGMIK